MKIFIGGDHAGFELKEKIKNFLIEQGYQVEDMGAFKLDDNDDYPDFIIPVANVNKICVILVVFGKINDCNFYSKDSVCFFHKEEYFPSALIKSS